MMEIARTHENSKNVLYVLRPDSSLGWFYATRTYWELRNPGIQAAAIKNQSKDDLQILAETDPRLQSSAFLKGYDEILVFNNAETAQDLFERNGWTPNHKPYEYFVRFEPKRIPQPSKNQT
jgi:hypothetical protein